MADTLVVLIIISELEFSLGVIAACCPAIVPLFRKNRRSNGTYLDIQGTPPSEQPQQYQEQGSKGAASGPRGWLEAAVGLDSLTRSARRPSDQGDYTASSMHPDYSIMPLQPVHYYQSSVKHDYSSTESG